MSKKTKKAWLCKHLKKGENVVFLKTYLPLAENCDFKGVVNILKDKCFCIHSTVELCVFIRSVTTHLLILLSLQGLSTGVMV